VKAVVVTFETFSPTKRYQKSIELPERVTLHHVKKDVTTKSMTLSLALPSTAPESATDKDAKVVANEQVDEPELESKEELSKPKDDELFTNGHAKNGHTNGDATVDSGTSLSPAPAQPAPILEEQHVSADVADAAVAEAQNGASSTAAKRRKKRAKKAKEDDDDVLDAFALEAAAEQAMANPEVALSAAREELTMALAHLQEELNRTLRGDVQRRVEAASEARKEAAKRVEQLEADLQQAKLELAEAVKEVDASEAASKASQNSVDAAKKRAQDAKLAVKSCEDACQAKQAEAEQRSKAESQRQSSVPPRKPRANESVPSSAADSKLHQKQKPEADKKEMARKMQEALGASIAGNEQLKAQLDERLRESQKQMMLEELRKADTRKSTPTTNAKPSQDGKRSQMKSEDIARVFGPSYDADPKEVSNSLELLAQEPGSATALLLLAQLKEDRGDAAGSGEVLLKFLAHPEADSACDAKMRNDLATRAMALLKDDPAKLRESLPLLGKLAEKYSILNMGYMLAGEESAKGKKPPAKGANTPKPPASSRPAVSEEAPREVPKPVEQPKVTAAQKAEAMPRAASTFPAAKPQPSVERAKAPLVEEVPDGWTLDKDTGDTAWVNDISLPEVSALADLNMEISTTSVRLSQANTGELVADIPVPESADADAAEAKWSKKRKVLTVRMPLRS